MSAATSASNPTPLENRKLKGALWYASQGWPAFPCRPRAKEPLTPHGFKDASTDPEQIRAWWSKWPSANVAIAIPADVVVVDIDGPDGLAALNGEGYSLPATARVRTGKGSHHWYRLPAGVVLRNAVRFLPCVDLRAVGSYVIAPPSVHPSGAVYSWDGSPAKDIAPAPDWILALTEPANAARTARPPSAWLEMIRGPIPEGHRRGALVQVAGLLFRYLPAEVAAELGRIWARASCTPPIEAAEVERILDDVAGLELRRRGGTS